MMPGNPAFGSTVLRLAAEQSPNFKTGVSGWFIGQDGTAEFNDVVVRGTIEASQFVGDGNGEEIMIYSAAPAAGNLRSSMTSGSGTDSFGNHFLAGPASYLGGQATQVIGGSLVLYTGSLAAGWAVAASFALDGFATTLVVNSPGIIQLQGKLTAFSGSQEFASPAVFDDPITATGGTTASPTLIQTDTGTLISSGFGAGWAASGSAVNGVWFLLLPDGMVYCAVDVKTTSTTPGGTICTIPAAYVPATNISGGHVNTPALPPTAPTRSPPTLPAD